MRPAFQISGGQDLPEQPGQPGPGDPDAPFKPDSPAFDVTPFFAGVTDHPASEPDGAVEPEAAPEASEEPSPPLTAAQERAAARNVGALTAKVNLMGERIKAQEATTARLNSAMDRVESTLGEMTKRTQPMLETLSAELARQGAMMESIRTDTESALDLQAQRMAEFEQRLASVLREMRELVAGKLESYDMVTADRIEAAHTAVADQLATFEERVEDLVRRFAGQAIPEEMRETINDISGRFVHAETALAASRSSVEFLRSEVGSLTMLVRKLVPPNA